MTEVLTTREQFAAARAAADGRVAVVMTMGALHEGHVDLLRAARKAADTVVATVFVNPLQFGPAEDFDQYPRTLDADVERCAEAGVDLVFAPSAAVMYPSGAPGVRVEPGALGEVLEGASRPGFFNGVLTVVLKLLNLTRPDLAFFGEKDYQQLTMIKRMVADLDLDVEVVGVATNREPDGLARSSRNRYLSPDQRRRALVLSAALRAAAATDGDAATRLGAAAAVVAGEPGVELDYLAIGDPMLRPLAPAIGTGFGTGPTDLPPSGYRGPARVLIAARVGTTRLIDNYAVEIS